jgi:integrase/recombinase XerD
MKNAKTQRIKESITEVEYKRLINFTKGDDEIKPFTKERFLKIYAILFYTGIRINEISQLRVEDLKSIINNGEVKIVTHKQNMERKLYFSQNAVQAIKKLFASDLLLDDDVKLIRKLNKPYASLSNVNMINTINKHMQKALGDSGYTSHSFRQGLITEFASKGVNTKLIQFFIGHRDSKTTMRYIRPTENDIRGALVR